MFNGAYVPAVETPVSAYIVVYPSSITFAYQNRPGTVAIPLAYQGSPLQIGISYSGTGTLMPVPTNAPTAPCEQGIQTPVASDNSALIINTTTPFSAVVFIQTTSPKAQPQDSTVTEAKQIAFSSAIGAIVLVGVIILVVLYFKT
jgi:hypothetical protein